MTKREREVFEALRRVAEFTVNHTAIAGSDLQREIQAALTKAAELEREERNDE